jgi:glucose-6-phosphate 1-dehydrogenase
MAARALPGRRVREAACDEEFGRFAAMVHYLRVDLSQPADYIRLKQWLDAPGSDNGPADTVVLYLATSPHLFPQICEQLGHAGLNGRTCAWCSKSRSATTWKARR